MREGLRIPAGESKAPSEHPDEAMQQRSATLVEQLYAMHELKTYSHGGD